MLLNLLPLKYQAWAAALPAILLLAFKVSAAIGSLGSVIEFVGMWRKWPAWIAVGKKFEALGTDFPKLLNDKVRPLLIRFGVKGLGVLLFLGAGTAGCTSSPCSLRNPEYAAHVAECDAAIDRECDRDANGRAVSTCPRLIECKAWAQGVCK